MMRWIYALHYTISLASQPVTTSTVVVMMVCGVVMVLFLSNPGYREIGYHGGGGGDGGGGCDIFGSGSSFPHSPVSFHLLPFNLLILSDLETPKNGVCIRPVLDPKLSYAIVSYPRELYHIGDIIIIALCRHDDNDGLGTPEIGDPPRSQAHIYVVKWNIFMPALIAVLYGAEQYFKYHHIQPHPFPRSRSASYS
ncbi:unnamed protein product [Tuber aestivum]|uniref:Uncharacterized protein n=1 Tax=Tuber aestivum TaxID=59557 RepID=A0A292Q2N1_9PEZI|nr:unnamed protein product [Tuber aestivum]